MLVSLTDQIYPPFIQISWFSIFPTGPMELCTCCSGNISVYKARNGEVLIIHMLLAVGNIMGATIFVFVTLLLNLYFVRPWALPGPFIVVSSRTLCGDFISKQRFMQMPITTQYLTSIYSAVTGKPLLLRECRKLFFSESLFGMCEG